MFIDEIKCKNTDWFINYNEKSINIVRSPWILSTLITRLSIVACLLTNLNQHAVGTIGTFLKKHFVSDKLSKLSKTHHENARPQFCPDRLPEPLTTSSPEIIKIRMREFRNGHPASFYSLNYACSNHFMQQGARLHINFLL